MNMKKFVVASAVVIAALGFSVSAFDLSGILGSIGSKENIGNALSGVVDGLLTQDDITVEQMAGTWTANGSAVAFQSDNLLKKAGGSAAASTIESKLDPYYKQLGLTGSTITIQTDGSFVMKVKGMALKGNITKNSDGSFNFAFTPFGNVKLGSIKTYVEKPLNGLNIMFDASKLKTLLSAIAGFTGNSLAKTAGSLLESYDGLLVGFAYSGNGNSGNNGKTTNNSKTDSKTTNGSELVNKATDALKGLFGK